MAKISFSQRLKNLFGIGKSVSAEFYEDLTDALIEGDIGAKCAMEITDELERRAKKARLSTEREITEELGRILMTYVRAAEFEAAPGSVNVFMALGVNGVGKTTTCAKLAKIYKERGVNVVLAAADTFRAAAAEQLALHAERCGVRCVRHRDGGDPSAVVFDAAEACRAAGGGLVLADTAGRLHNKENLVQELKKIDRVCARVASPGCYKKLLVIDATTGQNALRQAEVFNEAVGVDAVVLAKYDSTARGGALFSIGRELALPCAFVCTGERYGDIAPFDARRYVDAFLGQAG